MQFRGDLFFSCFAPPTPIIEIYRREIYCTVAWLAPIASWIHSHSGFLEDHNSNCAPASTSQPVNTFMFFGAFFSSPQTSECSSVQYWGRGRWGWLRDLLRLSFPPTSQVQSISPFVCFLYVFIRFFFFYVVRKTVVSMKLFEPEPHKNGWVLPMSEWHHEEETLLLWIPFQNCHVYNCLQALLHSNGYNVLHGISLKSGCRPAVHRHL